jgi:hypothetical protein
VPLSDHLHLEFRVETFNILNHPNFGDPSAPGAPGVILLGSGAGFGTSGQTLANSLGPDNVLGQLSPVFQIGGPRTIQFAVRLRCKQPRPRQCLGPIESSLSDWWAADNSIRGPSAFRKSPSDPHENQLPARYVIAGHASFWILVGDKYEH